jgi:4-hydroxybenzoyl-CoA thioesterase
MAYPTRIEVRFGDCDPAGIVYYPKLYHYCHVAFEQCWAGALGICYAELIGIRRLGFPTVHVETDFLSPARYGDLVDIDVWVSRIGRSSVVFEFGGRVGDRPVFRSTHTKVCVSLERFERVDIPDEHREALTALGA